MTVPHSEPSIHPYRHMHADSGAFSKIVQPTPHLPNTMPSQLPFQSSSWYIPSDTGLGWDASTASCNLDRPPSNSTVYDSGRSDNGDYCLSWEISPPARGYDAHILGHPLSLPPSRPQSLTRGDMLDEPFPRFKAYGTIYTDDVRMKLGDAIRRQCFNCRATQTTTWRRSTLSRGKLLCNKCGLFERTHASPRPKEFPRKRRSRPASARPSMSPPLSSGQECYHYNDRPSEIPFTSHIPNCFGTEDRGTPPQDASWMAQIMPHVSSTPPQISPCPTTTEQQKIFDTDFRSLSTLPTAATYTASPSWDFLPPHVN